MKQSAWEKRWRAAYYSLGGCLILGLLMPKPVLRGYYFAGDVVREGRLAWARWIARHHGVEILTRGPAQPERPRVCLTIDDGPHRDTGTAILDVLRREGVRATFFVVGVAAREHPELLRRMILEGHEIANHTWDHQRLTNLSPEKARRELRSLQELVERDHEYGMTLCRPPGGTYDARVLEICRDEGLRVCLWSVNAGDWIREKSAAEIAHRVLSRVHPGAIILMHDEMPATPEALPEIIRTLRERGYDFVTVSEMLPPTAPAPPAPWVVHRGNGS